jgi:hypothetical protein
MALALALATQGGGALAETPKPLVRLADLEI